MPRETADPDDPTTDAQPLPDAGDPERHLAQVNTRQFDELVDAGQPLVVQFGTPGCEPCHVLEPILARLAAQYRGQLQVVKVDVEQQAVLGRRYRVWVLPTVMAFHHGGQRRIGARDAAGLDAALRSLLAEASAAAAAGKTDAAMPSASERQRAGLLSPRQLHRSLSAFGRDIRRTGIPECLSEHGYVLEGLICRIGERDAAGIRVGCGPVITNRHVYEQLGGNPNGAAFASRRALPGNTALTARAAPAPLPGGALVMPWYVGRYADWALLEETDSSVCALPRLRSAATLRWGQTLWLVGGSDGDTDFVSVGRLKTVKGVNGLLSDCDVQPGMSGSAVIDDKGRVVGCFSTQFGWPGRRAMFVTIDCIAQGIDALRPWDATLPRLEPGPD